MSVVVKGVPYNQITQRKNIFVRSKNRPLTHYFGLFHPNTKNFTELIKEYDKKSVFDAAAVSLGLSKTIRIAINVIGVKETFEILKTISEDKEFMIDAFYKVFITDEKLRVKVMDRVAKNNLPPEIKKIAKTADDLCWVVKVNKL